MQKKIDWSKIDPYLIENYGLLLLKKITEYLGIDSKTLRCRASYLRKKGLPVKKYIINWRDPDKKTKLQIKFGAKPTHLVAKEFNKTIHAIYRAAKLLGISFRGNEGRYTFDELGKILKKDPDILRRWIKYGLKIKSYAKDGLTYSLSRKIKILKKREKFCALIDLGQLKKFLKIRPEAYNLERLDEGSKHFLELDKVKIFWKEKKIYCQSCGFHFWTTLYNEHPQCPKCRKFATRWAIDYR